MNVITSIDGVSLMADMATLPDCLAARRTAQWALGLAQKARDDLSRLPNVLRQRPEPESSGRHAGLPAGLCWCQVEYPLARALGQVID